MELQTFVLGAGEDVGRSCIIVKMFDKMIMLDCGAHMGCNGIDKYPNLNKLQECKQMNPQNKRVDQLIDLVAISHFHLDHVGGLPYFTKIFRYTKKIVMSTPTRCIVPHMLTDFRRVMSDVRFDRKKEDVYIYTQDDIDQTMSQVISLALNETIIEEGIKVTTYYAGHVLGACMFLVEYKGLKVVYTGDYNTTADRHLGQAWIDRVQPHLFISESTYATTLRDSKRQRESEFLKVIEKTISNNGKVLIPVFALGRAQELAILIDTYWNRNNLKVPVYFTGGLIDKANFYYKIFINWCNQQIYLSHLQNHNMMDFKNISQFDRKLIKSPERMVVFATPGMLHGGTSMQLFKEWCQDDKNLLIIPGYCVSGTLGNKLLQGVQQIQIDGKDYDIRMKIMNMSFSAHADARGILNTINRVMPNKVMLVHGEKQKMEIIKEFIESNFKIDTIHPPNFGHNIIQVNLKHNIHLELPFTIQQSIQNTNYKTGLQCQQISKVVMVCKRDNQNMMKAQIVQKNNSLQQNIQKAVESVTQSDKYEVYQHTFIKGYSIKIDESVYQRMNGQVVQYYRDNLITSIEEQDEDYKVEIMEFIKQKDATKDIRLINKDIIMEEMFGSLCIEFRANYTSKQIKNILMVLKEINQTDYEQSI